MNPSDMRKLTRFTILLAAGVLVGCKAFSPTYEDCAADQPYHSAREVPPLRVPEGLDMPNTRNALVIPEVTAPERPLDGRCIDAPPPYRTGSP